MSYSAWPSEGDLQAFLATITGLSISTAYDYSKPILGAIAEIERITEFAPFLWDGTTISARFYDPPGPRTTRPIRGGSRKLRLKAGIPFDESIVPTVTIGCDNPATQTLLVANQDYFLSPQDVVANGWPYFTIEFVAVQWGLMRSIQVNGPWGFSKIIPDDLWQACLELAAAKVARDVLQGIFASPTIQKEGNELQRQDSFRALGQDWSTHAKDVAQAYILPN